MKRFFLYFCCVLLVLSGITLGLMGKAAHAADPVYGNTLWSGDFETGNLSQWAGVHVGQTWGSDSSISVATQPSPVHQGNYSAKFAVNTNPYGNSSDRAELSATQANTGGYEGQSWYYTWSVYIPSNPDLTTGWSDWTNLMQWMDLYHNCSPPEALMIMPGYRNNPSSTNPFMTFVNKPLDNQNGCGAIGPYHQWDLGPVLYDQWINFTLHIKWSADPTVGFLQLWMNGKSVIAQQTMRTLDTSGGVYQEAQLYRGDNWSGQAIVYHDNIFRHDAYNPGVTSTPSPTPSSTTVNPLVAYPLQNTSATLASANRLGANTPTGFTDWEGWQAFFPAGKTGWCEANNLSICTPAATLGTPTPDGHGMLMDTSLLEGKSIPAGPWSGHNNLYLGTGANASYVARYFNRHANGTYTRIGQSPVTAAITGNGTYQGLSILAANLGAVSFGIGDKLYIDYYIDVTSNTSTGTVEADIQKSGSTTQAISADRIVTPGYTSGSSPTPTPSPTATPSPTPSATATPSPTPSPTPTPLPGTYPGSIKHAFVIMMENHTWSSIKGAANAPYINSLLTRSDASYASNYHNVLSTEAGGNLHPSEPNYIWTEAGTNSFSDITFTTDNDATGGNYTTSTAHTTHNLASWSGYMENKPSGCPITSSGAYAAKHDPFVFFADIAGNPPSSSSAVCQAHVKDYSALSSDITNNTLSSYSYIVPNLCNDMHDSCSPTNDPVKQGDQWLQNNLPTILNSSQYKADGAVFITWDEDDSGGNNALGMVVLSPFAKGGGYTNTISYSHTSLVKTIERVFSLPATGSAINTNPPDLADLFK